MNSGRKESARIRKSLWYVSPNHSTFGISVYCSLRWGVGKWGSSSKKGKVEGPLSTVVQLPKGEPRMLPEEAQIGKRVRVGQSFREESLQEDQTVSEMAQEVLMRQAKALAQRSGHSLEDACRAVSETQAGRQLRDLANGEHRHEKAQAWQASVFWDRAEERLMHQIGSEALSRFAAERHYSWVESYIERLEGKEERAR